MLPDISKDDRFLSAGRQAVMSCFSQVILLEIKPRHPSSTFGITFNVSPKKGTKENS
jgi:hypothetical protein